MLISDEEVLLADVIGYYGYTIEDVLGDYPIWDEDRRDWLNERIMEHFMYRQIAQDTPAMFAFFAARRMQEAMPALNPVFKALEEAADPTVVSSATVRAVGSVTPQTQLSGAENYADTLQDSKSETRGNAASSLSTWLSGVSNGLPYLFAELEPLFQQIWSD